MKFRALRLRVRQLVRKQRRHATLVTKQTDRSIERHFFGRLNRLVKVRRFIVGWILLFVLLIGAVAAQNSALGGYYQTTRPVAGGIFREGIVGTFTNANPLYATNDVDLAVSRLIFSGLFKYDKSNHVVGDLAQSWQVDQTGQIYTIQLRPNLTWHDGKPVTARDIVFTYNAIQNPDAESPLRANWVGIKTEAKNDHTVVFTLPNPLSSFVYSLTNGIVPAHLLRDIPMAGLRSASFNTQSPVGAGPFRWHDIKVSGHTPADAQESIGLLPFAGYWAGQPKLRTFTVQAFAREQDMIQAYKSNQLNAMTGLQQLPEGMSDQTKRNSHSFTVTAANMVFFRTTAGVLKDKIIRRALVASSKPADIVARLGYIAPRVNEPILASQFAYNSKYAQVTDKLAAASSELDKAGWRLGVDGIRVKGNQRLSFNVLAANTSEQKMVTQQLKDQWLKLGAEVKVSLRDDNSFHTALVNHDYDAVVYGITIGADPDVFVYWDSSQNDIRAANRLNLSEYDSDAADSALEAGRTRAGETLRRIKYEGFLKAWQQDAPALGLYQPRFLYVSRSPIYGLDQLILNTASERYNNVSNWMIRTAEVTNR
ncbi:peptide ABC transporter substrate-binding protein [soil metagenome]